MDSTSEKGDGKALPWTEEAKFQFLVRIVAQLRENGRSINWQKIEMPGRTVKSMQNMWTKINKLIAEVEQETGETPIKRPTPRKRTPKKGSAGTDNEDELAAAQQTPVKTTPKKRGAKSAGGSAKKAKKAVDDAQDDEIAFKEEPELEQWDEI